MPARFDIRKFISAAQVGGIDCYTLDEGPARGVRALCVNTGGGLRYRVLADRGLDIDQAFHHQHSLTFLSYKGVTPPTRALDRGLDWLKGFPVGLMTTGGPFNIGGPCVDQGEQLGLHGEHSNTAATIESILQPDPHAGRPQMSITGSIRYGAFYGPNVQLRRTISSTLGQNVIHFLDELHNAGNDPVPHAWLLHVNFGYPLVDQGAEICCNTTRVEPMDNDPSREIFGGGHDWRRISGPLAAHRGQTSAVGYLFPRPLARSGDTTVAIVNRKLSLGVAVHYNTGDFPRCGNWQHWGAREYVTALEPMTGTVDGRDKDRARGLLRFLEPGQTKVYRYRLEVVSDRRRIEELRKLNR